MVGPETLYAILRDIGLEVVDPVTPFSWHRLRPQKPTSTEIRSLTSVQPTY